MNKKHVLGIVGPTASGKTALSIPLAQKLNTEILCMDSMQVYRHMDIGTAKPSAEEQKLIPHHLIDLCDPEESFTVTDYANAATPILDRLNNPLLVGGTGLYLQALSTSASFGTVKSDEVIRNELHKIAEEKGVLYLHNELQKVDPVSASKFHPNDVRRVVRALEVYRLTGTPISAQKDAEDQSPYRFTLFGIMLPREILYERVNNRVDMMIRNGLVDEVRMLQKRGIPADATCMQGLGYKELYEYLGGTLSLADAVDLIKLRTRHFAKRQLTWFKRDQRIHWLDGSLHPDRLLSEAIEILERTKENHE